MQIEFLGTGGYHPNERRHTAGVLLADVGILFDAGTATFRVPSRLQTDELDIFLSHAHLDHIAGLTFLLPQLYDELVKPCRLHGTAKTLDAVRNHLFSPPVFPIEPPYEYVELTAEVAVRGGGTLTHVGLKHPGGSVGYRIDWPDRSMAYVTDTVADGSYNDFVRGVDVLIHECYFPDKRAKFAVKTGHSHTTPVAEMARDAGVKRMLLVHIDPLNATDDPIDINTARKIFPETEVAEDGLIVQF